MGRENEGEEDGIQATPNSVPAPDWASINTLSLSRSPGETITWTAIRLKGGLHYDFLSCLLLHSNKLYCAGGRCYLLSRESQAAASSTGSKMDISWLSAIMVSGWRNCGTPIEEAL